MGWKSGETQLTMDADTVARIIPENSAQGTHRSAARQKQKSHTCRHTGIGWLLEQTKINFRGVKAVDEERVDERVRQSQWMHWIGSNDPVIAQGQVLKNVRELAL